MHGVRQLRHPFPGSLVELTGYPFPTYNTEYVVLRCQHSFISQQYRTGAGSTGEDSYEGQYEFLESEVDFRPMQITPRPLVHGPQTAKVVGKEGEEIDCDEYGRILVRFHWDREDDQSMRCRVAQNWASKQWGGMIIPRIGMEVMVEFLEGDPDRPLVTGCVYNAENMPPYTLPQFKTRSTFKSDSHKAAGYNEFRFEDESGEEEIFLHGQKYLNSIILDDETWDVGGNRDFHVAKSNSQKIDKDKDMTVGGDHREEVGGSRDETIGGSQTRTIGGAENLTVGGDRLVDVGSNLQHEVGSDMLCKIGSKGHVDVGQSYFIDAGTNVVIDAGVSICLSVGGNFIKISPAGIQIEGTLVRINCGGAPSRGSSVSKKNVPRPKKYSGPHAKRYPRSSEK
ncbi:type VI secretion system tip protein TssI/VgrG [Hoeflea sp. IMCC20628]|uniref:type VI secretion system Vgr family protein n=1 Tax=Hoeflea sp. IMCC20628 TaxID=1620421 RepID=UPI001FD902F1|nr:type VI secretion system tip protein TssI/VgrG [Hoeflea sp. IMCC20628]